MKRDENNLKELTEATQKFEGMRAQLAMVQTQCDFWKRKHFEVERELQNLKREHGWGGRGRGG